MPWVDEQVHRRNIRELEVPRHQLHQVTTHIGQACQLVASRRRTWLLSLAPDTRAARERNDVSSEGESLKGSCGRMVVDIAGGLQLGTGYRVAGPRS